MKLINFDQSKFSLFRSFLNKSIAFAGLAAATTLYSCSNKNDKNASADSVSSETAIIEDGTGASYVSLNTASGKSSMIVKDTTSAGGYVYSDTYQPIEEDILFVEASTGDTLYGPQGLIVNNAVMQENGTWKVDKTKIKRDGDEIKIKSGDDKLKLEDDELKMKTGDSKMKIDDDEAKLKTPDSKTKVEDDETKVKPR